MCDGTSDRFFKGSPAKKKKKLNKLKKKNSNTNKLRAVLSIIKADF